MRKSEKIKALQAVETTNKVDESKNEDAFNEDVISFVDNEIENLLKKHSSVDMGLIVYNLMFHLSQKFIFEKMPIGRFFRSVNIGTKHASENYLDFVKREYDVKPKIEENSKNEEKNKVINWGIF